MRLLYFLFISCLIGGQVPFNGYQEQYISFINKTDNEEDAWVAFLKLCQKDIQYKNWVYVKRSIDAYKSKFMTKFTNYDTTRFMELKNIINFSYDNPKNYKVKWMPNNINTNKDERNPIMYNDLDGIKYLWFTRNSDNKRNENEDIYTSKFENGRWIIQPFPYNTNNPESITYASSNFIIYYSHKSDITRGSLFFSKNENEIWSEVEPIKVINTVGNFESDGVLSSDGRVLLFVSDRPSSLNYTYAPKGEYYHGDYWGNTDIYVSTMSYKGTWNPPINLGSRINTPFAERSPWLSKDGMTLYFSSDGHTGLGKLDVFKSTRLDPNSWSEWSKPENLGTFINSNNDEYGYKIIEDSLVSAIFSSQRDKKHFDIGIVTLGEKIQPKTYDYILKGKAIDANGSPLDSIPIVAENSKSGEEISKTHTNNNGDYKLPLPKTEQDISLYSPDQRFLPKTKNLESLSIISPNDKIISQEEKLEPSENGDIVNQNPAPGYPKYLDTLPIVEIESFVFTTPEQSNCDSTSIGISTINFATMDWALNKNSIAELNRLADYLKKYPFTLFISGHTDTDSTESYNQKLSEKRAESVKNYLISKGCYGEIICKGYGETMPLHIENSKDSKKLNRRVEFCIINERNIELKED